MTESLDIKKEQLDIKSFGIIRDYDQELQALWRQNIASTDSVVLCETCSYSEKLFPKPSPGGLKN